MVPALRLASAAVAIAVALSVMFVWPSWPGMAAAAAAFLIVGMVGDIAVRRVATPEQIQADLEDRVRNPPA